MPNTDFQEFFRFQIMCSYTVYVGVVARIDVYLGSSLDPVLQEILSLGNCVAATQFPRNTVAPIMRHDRIS